MKHYLGLDVSLEATAICEIDENGQPLKMTSAPSDPQAIETVLRRHASKLMRIVLESRQLSIWLTREPRAPGLPVVCVDAHQTHRALSERLTTRIPPMQRAGATGSYRLSCQ